MSKTDVVKIRQELGMMSSRRKVLCRYGVQRETAETDGINSVSVVTGKGAVGGPLRHSVIRKET